MTIDLFISHASEDKDEIARPLADELRGRGWRLWFDEVELTLGDSLHETIDRGLAEARFGVVILSPSFFAKDWPRRELNGLNARERDGRRQKVIIPVWHDVDYSYVLKFSPPLADRLAAKSTDGVVAIADQIERVLHGKSVESAIRDGPPARPERAGQRENGGTRRLAAKSHALARAVQSRPVRSGLFVVSAVAATAAGFVITGGDLSRNGATATVSSVSGGPLTIPYRGGWYLDRLTNAGLPGLFVSKAATLRHSAYPGGRMTVGLMSDPAPGVDPIPSGLRTAVSSTVGPRAEKLGPLQALTLRGHLRGRSRLALYVLPTSAGWTAMICQATTRAAAFLRICEQLVQQAKASGARLQSLGPDIRFADAVRGGLSAAAEARRAAADGLGSRSLATRARAADQVAAAYSRASRGLDRLAPSLRDRSLLNRLIRTSRAVARAFRRLASASRERKAGAYDVAADAGRRAERGMSQAIGDLRDAGYDVKRTR